MEPGGEFGFQNLPNYQFPAFKNSLVKEALVKWSMVDGLKVQAYSFDKPFRKYMEREFLLDFLGCQNVISTLMKATLDHAFSPMGAPVDILKFSEVKCTLTTLDIFEKIKQGKNIVRENGSIVKCMPLYKHAEINEADGGFDIEIGDNLRKMLLSSHDKNNEDADEDIQDVLSDDDKKEFLFSLFSHLVIGGSLCQYEDNIEPYIQTTKLLYKDLIAVAAARDKVSGSNGKSGDEILGEEGRLQVISHVYKIHCASNEVSSKKDILFNRQYLNNFFYIIVNPLKQICLTLYHHV